MRLHRFFIDADLTCSPLEITNADLLHQWMKVLRLQKGDALTLCNGKGSEAKGTLQSLSRERATVEFEQPRPVTTEPNRVVTLYCSVLKRENFEWVVQKSVEVGVKTIVPIIAERTVKTGLKMNRLRSIAREATEQSGRGIIPEISDPLEFDRALEKAKKGANIFFHCNVSEKIQPFSNSTMQQSNQMAKKHTHVSLGVWIGPEGGWTEGEVEQAIHRGFNIHSLGSLTLKAETAAVIASYLAIQDPGF
ncbi:hypothetical protein A3B61_04630 [Candidatus Peribacteria bacterium RIFCSPLOWO2_01_FULL_53_10]|nr:MAG: hypothetical protein A3B61_04630 [Candidatus Peribacteria bacterium RIFCSPLOWO2_01_FULL_53_10]